MLDPSTVRMRDELLNESLFFGLDHARSAIANGPTITTISGHTRRWDTKPRQSMLDPSPQPAPTLRNMKAAFPPVATNTPVGVVKTTRALIAVESQFSGRSDSPDSIHHDMMYALFR